MSDWVSYLPLPLLVVAFWLLVVRPTRTRQREFAKLQAELTPGLQVMLASGIYGELLQVDDDTVEVQIAPQTTITVARQAVGRIVEPVSVDAPDEESA